MNEKLKKIIYIVLGAFILLFLILFLVSSCSNKKDSLDTIESNVTTNTKNYYKNHKDELPKENTVLSLSLQSLIDKGIIKEFKKNVSCTGTMYIENNNDYYMYSPSIECKSDEKEFSTSNLKDTLLEKTVTSGNGLYNINGSYYFRGDKVDNYIIFDGKLWRIIKINSDNSIRLIEAGRRDSIIWDDRYNSNTSSSNGINDYIHNDISSRIKDSLDEIYNDKEGTIISNDAKGYIKNTSLCIGKRSLEDTSKDGSSECSVTLDNQYIGLLQLNDYLTASLDNNCINTTSTACSNYNYLADFPNLYWTLTASTENTTQVYKISKVVMASSANSSGMARMVINISENSNVKGTGTEEDPYKVVGTSTEIKK